MCQQTCLGSFSDAVLSVEMVRCGGVVLYLHTVQRDSI
jgi:hypothetical protein